MDTGPSERLLAKRQGTAKRVFVAVGILGIAVVHLVLQAAIKVSTGDNIDPISHRISLTREVEAPQDAPDVSALVGDTLPELKACTDCGRKN